MAKIDRLRRAYDQLRRCIIHVSDYKESPAFDAVFSMTTMDSGVAGIADRILEGQAIPLDQQSFLRRPRLRSSTFWELEECALFDLSPFPELVEWAKIIETARIECAKLV
jgi:hypothetical protein